MPPSRITSVLSPSPASLARGGLLREKVCNPLPSLPAQPQTLFDSLHAQIVELNQFIAAAYAEISSLRPRMLHDIEIPEATDELRAVVDATEAATNIILDSVERLEQLSANLPAGSAQECQSLVMKIYEASNFQDITGQRIKKVVNTLRGIETRVEKLVELFPDVETVPDTDSRIAQDSLLNGPQLPAAATNQDDIDALFNSD